MTVDLEEEFKDRCEKMSSATEWLVHPIGDTDFEKGVRRGIEIVLLTIREQHGTLVVWTQEEDGSYWIEFSLYENLTYREEFIKMIQQMIRDHRGDDDAIRAFSSFLRAQADEVDKAIGVDWDGKRRETPA